MDATVWYAVGVNQLITSDGHLITNWDDVWSELTEHLSMNGYTFDTNGKNLIFIYNEEISYLLTILEDRKLIYTVL